MYVCTYVYTYVCIQRCITHTRCSSRCARASVPDGPRRRAVSYGKLVLLKYYTTQISGTKVPEISGRHIDFAGAQRALRNAPRRAHPGKSPVYLLYWYKTTNSDDNACLDAVLVEAYLLFAYYITARNTFEALLRLY